MLEPLLHGPATAGDRVEVVAAAAHRHEPVHPRRSGVRDQQRRVQLQQQIRPAAPADRLGEARLRHVLEQVGQPRLGVGEDAPDSLAEAHQVGGGARGAPGAVDELGDPRHLLRREADGEVAFGAGELLLGQRLFVGLERDQDRGARGRRLGQQAVDLREVVERPRLRPDARGGVVLGEQALERGAVRREQVVVGGGGDDCPAHPRQPVGDLEHVAPDHVGGALQRGLVEREPDLHQQRLDQLDAVVGLPEHLEQPFGRRVEGRVADRVVVGHDSFYRIPAADSPAATRVIRRPWLRYSISPWRLYSTHRWCSATSRHRSSNTGEPEDPA